MSGANHTPLPNGNYSYGEPYGSGVRPVFDAHDQLLWYSVPGMETRFLYFEDAERVATLERENAELKAAASKRTDEAIEAINARNKKIERQAETIKRYKEALERVIKIYNSPNVFGYSEMVKVAKSALSGTKE